MRFRSLPTSVDENVPIPDVLPIDKNGYWTVCESVESWATKTWWRALVEPLDTLTNPFKVEISFSKNVAIVDAVETFENLDSNLVVFSVPSSWPSNLNLYVPIPAAVVPIPIILVLTKTSFGWSFSKFNDKIFELISDVNVPMKLDTGPFSVSE